MMDKPGTAYTRRPQWVWHKNAKICGHRNKETSTRKPRRKSSGKSSHTKKDRRVALVFFLENQKKSAKASGEKIFQRGCYDTTKKADSDSSKTILGRGIANR